MSSLSPGQPLALWMCELSEFPSQGHHGEKYPEPSGVFSVSVEEVEAERL